MKRIAQRIFYFIETLFQRSVFYQLLLVALGIGAISLTGGGLVYLFSPQFPDLSQAVWWAFLRLSDPGYLGDDKGNFERVVSTILTVAGYVVFLGALVAIMTNRLNAFMRYLASGRSNIFERDHILIIGWNPMIHAIVEEIVHAEERVKRRLDRSTLPAIAILCENYDPAMLGELRQKLKPDVRDECRLLIRSGDPLEAESLERVDFRRASAIILTASHHENGSRYLSDITLVKTLMTLKAESGETDPEELPNVVLEIHNAANKLLAESVGWERRTEALVANEFLSRLLCQSIRNPGISSVYSHILTDTYGESFYLASVDELGLDGQTLREAFFAFEGAIPVGFLEPRTRTVHHERRLRLLELDEPMSGEDEVICLSPSIGAIRSGFDPGRIVEIEREGKMGLSEVSEEVPTGHLRRVMVVGWSHILRPLLAEMGQHRRERFEVVVVGTVSEEEAHEKITSRAERHDNLSVEYRRLRLDSLTDARSLKPEEFDHIVLLSSERSDELVADAETVMSFVLLQRQLELMSGAKRPSFLVEINEEDNRALFQLTRHDDILATHEIIVHILSQVAVRRALAWLYEELFTQGGPEVRLVPFDELLDLEEDSTVDFDDCQRACLDESMIVLGYKLTGPRAGFQAGTHLNPDRDMRFHPEREDALVILGEE
jgi:hypothetical protein